VAAALVPALLASPASAKRPTADFTYAATIDCGSGSVEVVSTDDMFAPLVDLASGKTYKPVAWDIVVGDHVIQETKNRQAPTRRTAECSYSDGVATSTVTVKKV
jgi:hypothetical protein